jgi:3-oxoadipate enol-lactonase
VTTDRSAAGDPRSTRRVGRPDDAARAQCDDHTVPLLNHRVEGSGPVVLLLHAGAADLRMWDEQVRELAPDHMTVRCDLNGYGGSTPPPGPAYSDAEDVLALLDHLHVDRFSLVAASYGGHVGLQVATAAPDRVDALVLLAPLAELVPPDDGLQAFWAEEETLLEAGDLDAATELNVRTLLGPDADHDVRERLRVMQHDAFVAQSAAGDQEGRELPVDLPRLTMPATVVVGGHDLSFFRTTARAVAQRLPEADLVELAWAGHLPSLERPHETGRLVRHALSTGRT